MHNLDRLVHFAVPYKYRIDKARRAVLLTLTGTLTEAELQDGRRAVAANADFEPGFCNLTDATGVTRVEASSDFLRDYGKGALHDLAARRAIVVSSDALFGLSRMYGLSLKAGAGSVRIFRNLAEAKRWLGLD